MPNNFIITTPDDLKELIVESVRLAISENRTGNGLPFDSDYCDIDEAAKVLNLKKATVYQLTHSKRLPYINTGKKLYFRRSDLTKYIEAGSKSSASQIIDAIK